MNNTIQHQPFPEGNAQTAQGNNEAIAFFVSGLIGIPFLIVFLIVLLSTGNGITALKSAFVIILIGLLIGFFLLLF